MAVSLSGVSPPPGSGPLVTCPRSPFLTWARCSRQSVLLGNLSVSAAWEACESVHRKMMNMGTFSELTPPPQVQTCSCSQGPPEPLWRDQCRRLSGAEGVNGLTWEHAPPPAWPHSALPLLPLHLPLQGSLLGSPRRAPHSTGWDGPLSTPTQSAPGQVGWGAGCETLEGAPWGGVSLRWSGDSRHNLVC